MAEALSAPWHSGEETGGDYVAYDLVRHGLEPADDATGPADRLAVRRLGEKPDGQGMMLRGPRQAHLEGFDLHANVWVGAHDRAGVERLSRYLLRPPFAQEHLRLRGDGHIVLELKRVWHDGRELVLEPLEFLERLAAMTPRPEKNLLICHGLLAPRARWRERVIAYGRVRPEPSCGASGLTRHLTRPPKSCAFWFPRYARRRLIPALI